MDSENKRRLWIGTSGWVYPHWRSVFYPPKLKTADWLSFYARHFATVELNNSFYRLPSERAFDAWRDTVPPGFRFAVKANRYLTHMKKLRDPAEPLERFLSRTRRLGDRLGPILYQLPPNWNCNLERLSEFLSILPADLTHAFEFRNATWFTEEVFVLLADHGAAFCIISLPGAECPLRATAPTVYIRLHGSEAKYGSCYREDELQWWAGQVARFLAEGREVYVYFNNDAFGYAVQNARRLRELLEQPPVSATLSARS